MKKIIKIVAFALLLGEILFLSTQVFMQNDNYAKYMEFYKEEEDFDVLFFGSSRMLTSVNPVELYDEYGFTSYNMAQHGEGLKITYWQVKNALKYTNPKVILVDVSLFWEGKYEAENLTGLSYLHKSLDHMSLSKMKYDAVKDNVAEEIDIKEYLLPFYLYHDRWGQLTKDDFLLDEFYSAGAETKYGQGEFEKPQWNDALVDEELSLEAINLEPIYALCEEKNVELVLTYMPIDRGSLTEEEIGKINKIEQWAVNEELPFLNLATEYGLIDYQTDMYDAGHVNVLGMHKITSFLGEFLSDKYEFVAKGEKTLESWDVKLEEYQKIHGDLIEKETVNLYTLISMIARDEYSYVISVNAGMEFFSDPMIETYLRLLGAETDFSGFEESKPNYSLIKDAKNGEIYEYVNEASIYLETSIGKVQIAYDEERNKNSDIGGYVYYETLDYARVDITVFDADTGEMILRGYY